jgi:hypothetical protein
MKKLVLAFVALAFAVSSCCDQNYCSGKKNCEKDDEECGAGNRGFRQSNRGEETPYRWDNTKEKEKSKLSPDNCQQPDRQHRRW